MPVLFSCEKATLGLQRPRLLVESHIVHGFSGIDDVFQAFTGKKNTRPLDKARTPKPAGHRRGAQTAAWLRKIVLSGFPLKAAAPGRQTFHQIFSPCKTPARCPFLSFDNRPH